MDTYKPSKKGSLHFKPDDRIIVVDKTYVWFKKTRAGYSFEPGDVCEDKSHMRRCPDSFWTEAEDVDPSIIEGVEAISDYNREVYGDMLRSIGVRL